MSAPSPPAAVAASGRFAPAVLALVLAGGAVGAAARHAAEQLDPGGPASFPIATFAVNVSGAFGLGLLLATLDRARASWTFRPLIATGFFGAYTTFSTFAVELVTRIRDHHLPMALLYAAATLAVGLALATAGRALGHRVGRPAQPAAP